MNQNILDAMAELVKAHSALNNPPKRSISMGNFLSNCDEHVKDAYEHIIIAYDILLKEVENDD
jgi:hypothetical protein